MNTLKKLKIDQETLVIVTADHGHTMTLQGYAARGADINGFLRFNEIDQKLETPMVYANGPGAKQWKVANGKCSRVDLAEKDISNMEFIMPAAFPRYEESHGSEDVGLWATGPLSFLFHRTHEQSYIGHVLAFSLCIGHFKSHPYCQNHPGSSQLSKDQSDIVVPTVVAIVVIGAVGLVLFGIWQKTKKGPYGQSRQNDPETMS